MISQLKNGTLKDITDLTYEIMLLEREAEARGFNQYKIQLFQERLEEQEKKEKESK